ncbi:hypothetical protein K8I61_18415 [bacterium]|nr:hypothetical protein [bacterium]
MRAAGVAVGFLTLVSLVFAAGCTCGDDDDDSVTGGDDDTAIDDDADDNDADDDDTASDDDTLDDDFDDDAADDDAEPLPPFLRERPRLTDFSSWVGRYDAANPKRLGQIAPRGLGNGRAFALVASSDQFLEIRNHIGPNYEKYERFFSDLRFQASRGESPIGFQTQDARRPRGTGVVVMKLAGLQFDLWAIDFAPEGDGIDGTALADAIVRVFVVWNRSDTVIDDLSIAASAPLAQNIYGRLNETIGADGRQMVAGWIDAPAQGGNVDWIVPPLAPGEEAVAAFAVAYAKGGDPHAVFNAVDEADADVLLTATLDSWKGFFAGGARVSTSDPRLSDIIEEQMVVNRVQTSFTGGVGAMGEYSRTWTRDMMGTSVLYPLVGQFEAFGRMLDYEWLAILQRGDIGNSYALDIELPSLPSEPDWDALPPGTGRNAGEQPSYIVLRYREYYRATGDLDRLEERYGLLRRAILVQTLHEGCYIDFSGDETFRLLMAVAFGQWLFDEFGDTYYSANSSFLYVIAAEFLADIADELGYTADADEYRGYADAVRGCLENTYWLAGKGYYATLVDKTTLLPNDMPYEDVNTIPLWMGYESKVDPDRVAENLRNTIDALAEKDGFFHSPLASYYKPLLGALGINDGLVTGMTYGYVLSALARIDDPRAEAMFLTYDDFFNDAGNVSEAMIVDDFSRLTYLQEPFGLLVDLTARYRAWEGGIDAAAILQYLLGLTLNAPEGRIAIAPHLPDGITQVGIEDARAGDISFDLEVDDDGATRTVAVSNTSAPLGVDAVVSVEGTVGAVRVNGVPASPASDTGDGRTRLTFAPLSAGPGEDLRIEIDYTK